MASETFTYIRRPPGTQDSYNDKEKWVCDSSMDSKGRVPLRSATGAWKASLFIIAMEFSERLSYFGIATNLVVYLTTILHQDLKTAVRNVNYWFGVTTLMPLLGGFVADAYLGRYPAVLAATFTYLMGLILLSLSWFIPALKACDSDTCDEPRKQHEIVFFIAIYLISVATGGHKPALESFGADQFDDDHVEERRRKMSYFNWWNFCVFAGILISVTLIVYVEDRFGWGVAGIILTSVMSVSFVIFFSGRSFYRYREPSGSVFIPMLRVFTAAILNRHLPYPSDSSRLHEISKSEYANNRLLSHTKNLKFLDKAAIYEAPIEEKPSSSWRLTTVTKVEEVKLIVNMIPIWLTSLAFGICTTQSGTFFVKQAVSMDLRITRSFSVPPASMTCLSALGTIISVVLYEKLLVPLFRQHITGHERGISLLQRIGAGMFFSFIAMIIAALVENARLDRDIRRHEPPMSVLWLAPQFILTGIADSFALVGLQEYFYDQVPDSMRSLGIAFYLSVIGAASFINNVLIAAVDCLSEHVSGKSWFGEDLNSSRVDRFYWLLAVMTAVDLFVFVLLAKRYSYKIVRQNVAVGDGEGYASAGTVV